MKILNEVVFGWGFMIKIMSRDDLYGDDLFVFMTNFFKFELELSGKNFIVLSYLLTKFTVIVINKWKVVLVTWTWNNNCSSKLASNLVLFIARIAWCIYMRYTTLSKEQCLGIKTFSYHILCCALDNPQMH